MTNSVDPDQTVWSWSTLFASILEFISNVRQLFAADDFSRRHFSGAFFLGALRVNGKQAQKCIRMGITIFKMFICESISSNIWSKITFYDSANASPKTYFFQDISSKMKIQLSPKSMIILVMPNVYLIICAGWNILIFNGSYVLPYIRRKSQDR